MPGIGKAQTKTWGVEGVAREEDVFLERGVSLGPGGTGLLIEMD